MKISKLKLNKETLVNLQMKNIIGGKGTGGCSTSDRHSRCLVDDGPSRVCTATTIMHNKYAETVEQYTIDKK